MENYFGDNLSALVGHAEQLSNELSGNNNSTGKTKGNGGVSNGSTRHHSHSNNDMSMGMSGMDNLYQHHRQQGNNDIDSQQQQQQQQQQHPLSGNKRVRDDGDMIMADYVNSVNNSMASQQQPSQHRDQQQQPQQPPPQILVHHGMDMSMLQHHQFQQQQQHQQQLEQHLQQQHHNLHQSLQQQQHQQHLQQLHHHIQYHQMNAHLQQQQQQHQQHQLHQHVQLQQQQQQQHHHQAVQQHHAQQLAAMGLNGMSVVGGHNGSVDDILAAANLNSANGMIPTTLPIAQPTLTFNGVPFLNVTPSFVSVIANPSIAGSTANSALVDAHNNMNLNLVGNNFHLHNMVGPPQHQQQQHQLLLQQQKLHVHQQQQQQQHLQQQQQRDVQQSAGKGNKKHKKQSNGRGTATTSHQASNSSRKNNQQQQQQPQLQHPTFQSLFEQDNHDGDEDNDDDGDISPTAHIVNVVNEMPITPNSHKARSPEEEHCVILERSTNSAAKCSNTKYRCMYCMFEFVGGPQKIRVHLTGKRENGTRLSKCERVPEDVRILMESRMKTNKKRKHQLPANGSNSSNNVTGTNEGNSGNADLVNEDIAGEFDDVDDEDDENGPLVQGLTARNVEEQHCIVLSRSANASSKSSNSKYKCIYCRFRFVGGPQKIRVHLTGIPEGGTRVIKCTKAPKEVVTIMECRRRAPKMNTTVMPTGLNHHSGYGAGGVPGVQSILGSNNRASATTATATALLSSHNTLNNTLNFALQQNLSHSYALPMSLGLALTGGLPSVTANNAVNLMNSLVVNHGDNNAGGSSGANHLQTAAFGQPVPSAEYRPNIDGGLSLSVSPFPLPSVIVENRGNENTPVAAKHTNKKNNHKESRGDEEGRGKRSSNNRDEGNSEKTNYDYLLLGGNRDDVEPIFDTITSLSALAHTAMSNNIEMALLSSSSSSSSSAESVQSMGDDDTLGSTEHDNIPMYNFDIVPPQLSDLHRDELDGVSHSQPDVYDMNTRSQNVILGDKGQNPVDYFQ